MSMKKEKTNKKEEEKIEHLEELKQVKNKTFFTALGHAIDGVIKAFKTERNLRIDYLIGVLVFIASLFFDFTKTEFACLCLTIGFVIFSEMINSTVEYIVDLITDRYDDRAKAAKDIAAGGVLISTGVALVVAYFLFADKLYNATTSILTSILSSKLHILATIIFTIILLAVILKGIFGKSENYSKSFPSARVALAFGITTFAYLITGSIFVGGITFLLSFMIIQLRIENTKAKPLYMIMSAAMGILVVLIIYQIVLMGPDIESFISNIFRR
ncbi:MAG: diacylglycerol kinase [Clostridia bacterium]|nr:diacylglycerol kinase [Clostridia bacterium]